MRPAIIIAAALVLSGCAGQAPEAKIEVQTANVAVAVHCKTDIGPDPVYPDTRNALLAAPTIFDKTKLLLTGRSLRIQREVELWAAIKGCE